MFVWNTKEKWLTNTDTSLRLLLFTVLTHARSDQVSNITASEETNPLFHVASLPLFWRGHRCAKPRGPSNSGRTEEAATHDFSHSSVVITAKGRGGRKRSWGAGWCSVRECRGVGYSSSCPWVYWSVIALRGRGQITSTALPFKTTGPIVPAQQGLSSYELTVNHSKNSTEKWLCWEFTEVTMDLSRSGIFYAPVLDNMVFICDDSSMFPTFSRISREN